MSKQKCLFCDKEAEFGEEDIKRIIEYFRGRDEVSALYLFGSLGTTKENNESDIDIGVLVNEDKLHGRKLDKLKKDYFSASPAFSLRSIDIVILNNAGAFLKYRILNTGKVLFDRNRRLRMSFTEKALNEYLDFRYIEEIFHKAVGERIRRGAFGR